MALTLTFITDCPVCKAKVAAAEQGRAVREYFDSEEQQPYGQRLYVGNCPKCHTLLAGESTQIGFENFDSEEDVWSDVVRIYPKPPKSFSSSRIPTTLKDSLLEADRSLQANANFAACVMFGRALESLCNDILKSSDGAAKAPAEKPVDKKRLMLAAGIKELRKRNIIDGRLLDWSQQLRAFRNIGAHPGEDSISRQDAEDLQTFVYAIVEYIYDLSDRYSEFKGRLEKTNNPRKK